MYSKKRQLGIKTTKLLLKYAKMANLRPENDFTL